MQQAASLNSTDRAAIQASLSRLVANAYGAMATLPLYCLGELPVPIPASAVVMERYDVWHSCVVVTREVLRSASSLQSVDSPLVAIAGAVDGLRDAFLALLDVGKGKTDNARSAFATLVQMYESLVSNVSELAREVEIDEQSVLPGKKSVRFVAFERTLRWFGNEIANIVGKQTN